MTSNTGFIVINNEGRYAREYEAITHGGRRTSIEWVDNLNSATVFINKVYAVRRNKELDGKAMLSAEVTRVVRITGQQR